jgi:hypothetical protein
MSLHLKENIIKVLSMHGDFLSNRIKNEKNCLIALNLFTTQFIHNFTHDQ